jgi:H+/Cl- antiporter ClcA
MHAAVQITLESAIVGALTTAVGTVMARIIQFITEWRSQVKTDTSFNKYFIMEICLFLTGFTVNIITEFSGLNLYYCRHGYACKNI